MTGRLAQPDWDRPNETWRVEAEAYVAVEPGGVCEIRDAPRAPRCYREGVAVYGRYLDHVVCAEHLRRWGMWIENRRVVSWTLRP